MNVMPAGNPGSPPTAFVAVSVGMVPGKPGVVVTVKLPGEPSVKAVALALVMAGAGSRHGEGLRGIGRDAIAGQQRELEDAGLLRRAAITAVPPDRLVIVNPAGRSTLVLKIADGNRSFSQRNWRPAPP